ncbi:hypothetical protein Verru16b_00912 [Lacunisphaera limnophila]|uniref:SLA1 homology domain-containing protein n=1 Tax=Lacunisphaera limnophila TaxID=1838286 RepID=A0A1D8ASH8_9BACT|nr:hypothetical protein [Lacunisphaera limnophila]AOS43854.1 hypothetical protein Verru16b_00912 [Lacunisphaera limnophila]
MNPAVARLGLAALLLGGAANVCATAEVEPAAAPPADKSHVLYMGANLSVQQGKRYYDVEDVDGSEFIIRQKGEKTFVRTRMARNNVKVQRALKLAPLSVKLDAMQGAAGYTPAADPRHKYNARSGAQGGAEMARNWSAARQAEAEDSLSKVRFPEFRKQYEDIIDLEKTAQVPLNQLLGSNDYVSIPGMQNELALELAEGNYDLMEVSFLVSSPEPLDDPYMVIVVDFQPRGAKPGETATLIHAKALDPIGPEPQFIHMREGGMPVGFKYLRHEVHIYNRGQEVATSESSKRVELSRDEAREYLVIEHLAAHKKDTVPAAAVPGSLPPGLRSRLEPDQLNRVCYVRVSREGKLLGVFVDEAASLPQPDAAVNAALAGAFFIPAVAAGKPMEGVVRVRVAELAL